VIIIRYTLSIDVDCTAIENDSISTTTIPQSINEFGMELGKFKAINVEVKDGDVSHSEIWRPLITSKDKSFGIQIHPNKIDSVLTNININVFEMPSIEEFISKCDRILSVFSSIFPLPYGSRKLSSQCVTKEYSKRHVESRLKMKETLEEAEEVISWQRKMTTKLENTDQVAVEMGWINANMIIDSKSAEFAGLYLQIGIASILQLGAQSTILPEFTRMNEEIISTSRKQISLFEDEND